MSEARESIKIPTHVGLIMDGNGRWATQRGLPRLAGHKAGVENVTPTLMTAKKFGIQYVTFYAFSTENWKRPLEEVGGIMTLLSIFIDREVNYLHKEGVRILHIGHREHLDPKLLKKIDDAIELTKNNTAITVQLGLDYGGRDEITQAVRKIVASGTAPEAVTEELISQNLYTAGIPDPDLVIRTSGEMRTSNFLIWQSAYAEWIFPETYWPDFTEEVFWQMLVEYSRRDRRFGGLSQA